MTSNRNNSNKRTAPKGTASKSTASKGARSKGVSSRGAPPKTATSARYAAPNSNGPRKRPKRKGGVINAAADFVRQDFPSITAAAGVVGVLLVLWAVVWLFTNKNAYEVFLEDKSIGYVAYNKNITAESLYDTAIKKLTAEVGINVQVNEKLALKRVHSSKKQTADYVVEEVKKGFTYTIEACAIVVNGVELGFFKTEKEAEELFERVKKQYVQAGSEIVETAFVDEVKTVKKFINPDELTPYEIALNSFSAKKMKETAYSVRKGDTLWGIAKEFSLSSDELISLNPGLAENSVLRVGQQITLVVPEPIISVRTVEQVKYTEVEPKTKETRLNTGEKKSYSKVIQQGRDGQREVTAHIVRINGFQTEKTVVSREITVPPVAEIIEVGTQ